MSFMNALRRFAGCVLILAGSLCGLWGLLAENYTAEAKRHEVLSYQLSNIQRVTEAIADGQRRTFGEGSTIDVEPKVSWGYLVIGALLVGAGGAILPLNSQRGGPNQPGPA
jgi:hypothetical protein